jgi:5-(carboxyamino)imidazole ribonucleotide mutase
MSKVLILLGSKSDMEFAEICSKQLADLGIASSIEVSSAHRNPEKTAALASQAESSGFEIIVAMAGLSAALPGVAAAHSNLPVIGVPLPGSLGGLDALLSVVQMPPGVPVAGVAIGAPGAKNAAVLAARILALKHPQIKTKLEMFRRSLGDA